MINVVMSYDVIKLSFLTVLTFIRPSNVREWVYHLLMMAEILSEITVGFCKVCNFLGFIFLACVQCNMK